jgi:membrane protease YdiL (CAAX protease family)
VNRIKFILFYFAVPAAACFVLFALEQILMVDYVTKTIAKLMLFLSIPLAVRYIFQTKSIDLPSVRSSRLIKQLLPGAGIGLAVIGVVAAAYMLVHNRIDSVSIMAELNEKSGITKQTYLFTGLYITFVNSFLEEWFFRNFLFSGLYQRGMRHIAYGWSALLFSVYHLAIFNTWFTPLILGLALLGLMAAGLFLNYMVRRTGSLLSSWLIHLSANIAIIGIGYTWLVQH